MKNKQKWIEFIVENFKPGRVKDISAHIKHEAEKQNFHRYRTSNTIESTVEKLLQNHCINTPLKNESVGRKRDISIHKKYFIHDSVKNEYSLLAKEVNDKTPGKTKLELELIDQPPKYKEDLGEKISITTPKDKSIEHNNMLLKISEYARERGYELGHKNVGIDLLLVKNNELSIVEVKSYQGSIYIAIGQLLFYKTELFKNIDTNYKVKNLFIVGNFNLPEKFDHILQELNIRYIKEENFIDNI